MTRSPLPFALALILSAPLAPPALAHEFNLLLLAPATASPAEVDNMRTAFLIASHERDSHPDETSEGHLGGMDVQLTLARMGEAPVATDPDFVAAPLAGAGDAQVAALAAPGDAVIVDGATVARIAPGERPDLAPFADRFLAQTGHAPDGAALGAYRAARIVDLAVRPLGAVDDRNGLRRALNP